MNIGIDFDNTIVCYDNTFSELTSQIEGLPSTVKREKMAVRDYLREQGREKDWIELQGQVYGPGMVFARPFQGALSAMKDMQERGHRLKIISHRSKKPYGGAPYDLHSYAKDWIKEHLAASGLFINGCDMVDIYFYETLEEKLNAVVMHKCDVFIDDLHKVVTASVLPLKMKKILFHPDDQAPEIKKDEMYWVANTWEAIGREFVKC